TPFGILVTLYATAAVIAGIAPKDLPDTPHTTASQIHVDATILGGVALVLAMILASRRQRRASDRTVASVIASLVVAGAIVYRFTWGTCLYGVVERSLLALAGGWVSFV